MRWNVHNLSSTHFPNFFLVELNMPSWNNDFSFLPSLRLGDQATVLHPWCQTQLVLDMPPEQVTEMPCSRVYSKWVPDIGVHCRDESWHTCCVHSETWAIIPCRLCWHHSPAAPGIFRLRPQRCQFQQYTAPTCSWLRHLHLWAISSCRGNGTQDKVLLNCLNATCIFAQHTPRDAVTPGDKLTDRLSFCKGMN